MAAPNNLAAALNSEAFIITCELDPPKGTDAAALGNKAVLLAEKVQAIVVSDNPKARLHMAPIGLCKMLLDQGLEPVMTLTCRDRNRLALQSDLLAAAGLGIKNILAVTGDYITWGDHPEGKPVYDLDSLQLIRVLSLLNANQDLNGGTVDGPAPEFTIGAAVTITGNPILPQVLKFKKKKEAGAHFFISHPIFDLAEVEDFFKEVPGSEIPLLASVCLLKEEQIRNYNSGTDPGLFIPDAILDQYRGLPWEGLHRRLMEDAGRLIENIKEDGRFRGVHLMLQGEEERIGELI
jgi:methylenetetrahydrofolate reductase (NADPH)